MALIVPPSARPLNWAITFPITAPTFAAPPSIAATTAARISSSLDRRRQIRAEHLDFGAFDRREIVARALVVHLDRLAPALDAAAQHLVDVVVGEVALELDLAILDVGDDGAEQQDRRLVLRLAGRGEIGLQTREQCPAI